MSHSGSQCSRKWLAQVSLLYLALLNGSFRAWPSLPRLLLAPPAALQRNSSPLCLTFGSLSYSINRWKDILPGEFFWHSLCFYCPGPRMTKILCVYFGVGKTRYYCEQQLTGCSDKTPRAAVVTQTAITLTCGSAASIDGEKLWTNHLKKLCSHDNVERS